MSHYDGKFSGVRVGRYACSVQHNYTFDLYTRLAYTCVVYTIHSGLVLRHTVFTVVLKMKIVQTLDFPLSRTSH